MNGGVLGTSAQLSTNPLPPGLSFSFAAALSNDTTDVTLTYVFTNITGGVLSNVQFFFLLDPEIEETDNTFLMSTPS